MDIVVRQCEQNDWLFTFVWR